MPETACSGMNTGNDMKRQKPYKTTSGMKAPARRQLTSIRMAVVKNNEK